MRRPCPTGFYITPLPWWSPPPPLVENLMHRWGLFQIALVEAPREKWWVRTGGGVRLSYTRLRLPGGLRPPSRLGCLASPGPGWPVGWPGVSRALCPVCPVGRPCVARAWAAPLPPFVRLSIFCLLKILTCLPSRGHIFGCGTFAAISKTFPHIGSRSGSRGSPNVGCRGCTVFALFFPPG